MIWIQFFVLIINKNLTKLKTKKKFKFLFNIHYEFYKDIECNINLCERSLSGHDTFKERFEFYFSINQLNEIIL